MVGVVYKIHCMCVVVLVVAEGLPLADRQVLAIASSLAG